MIQMGLLLDGKSMNSPACRTLMAKYQREMIQSPSTDAVLTFNVEQAFMGYDDTEHKCRPYLMLLGRPAAIVGDFPCGVNQMRYSDPLDRSLIAYRYELSRHNLTEMVAKGMYDDGFEIPSIIRENEFELPCKVNCATLPSEQSDLPPVMFASLEVSSLCCSDETSGYVISSYFDTIPEPAMTVEAEAKQEDNVYQRTLEDTAKEYETVVSEPAQAVADPEPAVPPENKPYDKKFMTAPSDAKKLTPVTEQHRDTSGLTTPQAPAGDDMSFLI